MRWNGGDALCKMYTFLNFTTLATHSFILVFLLLFLYFCRVASDIQRDIVKPFAKDASMMYDPSCSTFAIANLRWFSRNGILRKKKNSVFAMRTGPGVTRNANGR